MPIRKMLPYQAVAMDYAVTSSFQRHQAGVNMNLGLTRPDLNMNLGMSPAFTHSWFVPGDACAPISHQQTGHVLFIIIIFARNIDLFEVFSGDRLCMENT